MKSRKRRGRKISERVEVKVGGEEKDEKLGELRREGPKAPLSGGLLPRTMAGGRDRSLEQRKKENIRKQMGFGWLTCAFPREMAETMRWYRNVCEFPRTRAGEERERERRERAGEGGRTEDRKAAEESERKGR